MIHAHIRDVGIETILEPISITAPEFEEELKGKGNTRIKASHVEYAIRDSISAKTAEDPAFYGSLNEKLEQLISDDKKRRKDEAQLLAELLQLKTQGERRESYAKSLGLEPEEFSIFGKVEPYCNDLSIQDDVNRAKFTKELVGQFQDKTKIIDWQDREDIQKEMRRDIKEFLVTHGFPKQKLEMFTRELIDLSKVLFRLT